MFDQPVAAHIEVTETADRWALSAFVASAGARRLTWRLDSVSRSSGGSSTVSQSGVVDSPRANPVAVLTINRRSLGEVVLRVFEGDREVASDTVDLSKVKPSEPPI